jgi:glutamine amidotransferase
MCELLAMVGNEPAILTKALQRFAQRGGLEGPHADGWGLASYDGVDARLIREPEAASNSRWMEFLYTQRIPSRATLAHIRKATVGSTCLPNTQPFRRELGGRVHLFMHNGDLDGIDGIRHGLSGLFRPIGTTDSEVAFCHLLDALQSLWLREAEMPSRAARFEVVAEVAQRLSQYGPCNFVYSDSDTVFVYGHRRTQPSGRIEAPGMVAAERECSCGRPDRPQRLMLFASVPLSDEPWYKLREGELFAVPIGDVDATQRREVLQTTVA